MKGRTLKSLICLVSLCAVVLLMTACGDNTGGNGGSSADEPKAQLTKEEYLSEVNSKCDEIAELSMQYQADVDMNDLEKALSATKSMVENVKPLYEELGALNAPAEFQDKQKEIKEGCDASAELLELSLQLIEMESAQDVTEIQSITDKIQELTPKVTQLNTVLNEVRAA